MGDCMKKATFSRVKMVLSGAVIGLVNGALGAGGGMLAVPLLSKYGLEKKECHANAVAVILPITVVSAVLYLYRGYVNLSDAIVFVPTGLIGSLLGTVMLKKISNKWLGKIFGFFMIYAGVRLLLK